MPDKKFRNLQFDALVELLLQTTCELLAAIKKADNGEEINARRKQVELLHSVLLEKLIQRKALERPGPGIV